jgi:hypothetical protein
MIHPSGKQRASGQGTAMSVSKSSCTSNTIWSYIEVLQLEFSKASIQRSLNHFGAVLASWSQYVYSIKKLLEVIYLFHSLEVYQITH